MKRLESDRNATKLGSDIRAVLISPDRGKNGDAKTFRCGNKIKILLEIKYLKSISHVCNAGLVPFPYLYDFCE